MKVYWRRHNISQLATDEYFFGSFHIVPQRAVVEGVWSATGTGGTPAINNVSMPAVQNGFLVILFVTTITYPIPSMFTFSGNSIPLLIGASNVSTSRIYGLAYNGGVSGNIIANGAVDSGAIWTMMAVLVSGISAVGTTAQKTTAPAGTININAVQDGIVLDCLYMESNMQASSGQTQIMPGTPWLNGSYRYVTTDGTQTMSWAPANLPNYSHVAIALNPV